MSLDEFDKDEENEFNEDDDSDDKDVEDDDNEDVSEDDDFSEMTVKELKAKCEELGIDTKGMKKEDLIAALENNSEEE